MSTLNYYGSDPSGTKLPFWKTVGAAYAAVFENFAALLKASWLWLILAAVLTANTMWTVAPWQAEVMAALMKQQPVPPAPWQLTALQAASTIAMGIGGVSMAVAWHRLLLLGEQPSILGNFFTPAFWRYVIAGMAIAIVAFIPILVLGLPTWWFYGPELPVAMAPGMATQGLPRPNQPSLMIFLVLLIAFICAIALSLRLVAILPARAVGQNDLTFREVWEGARGNSGRLFAGSVVCTLPPMLLAKLLLTYYVGVPKPPFSGKEFDIAAWTNGLAIPSAILVTLNLVLTMIAIGFLSYAYRHVFERK